MPWLEDAIVVPSAEAAALDLWLLALTSTEAWLLPVASLPGPAGHDSGTEGGFVVSKSQIRNVVDTLLEGCEPLTPEPRLQ